MKKIFYLPYLFLFIALGCKSQINNKNIVTIEITDINYGKLSQSHNSISLLSKATKINKKYFSSAIYGKDKNKIICYPIDDRFFNHDYFNGYDYNQKRKVKIYLQKYLYENNEYLIAVKIE